MNHGTVSAAKPPTSSSFPFPGIATSSDGAGAVTWVETNITQGACAYPITSSTTMGTGYQTEVSNGKKNLWGDTLHFVGIFCGPIQEHQTAATLRQKTGFPIERVVLAHVRVEFRILPRALWTAMRFAHIHAGNREAGRK